MRWPCQEPKKKVWFLTDGSADFEAVLVELDVGFLVALGVGEELVGVEGGVAEEVEGAAVELVGPGAGGDGDGGAGVAALLGGGVGGGDLELLDVVGIEAEDVVDGVGVGGFVGVDAVDGDVVGGEAGAVDVDGVAGTLDDAGFEDEQGEGVAAVQGEVDDGLLLDDVAEGGVRGLEDFGGAETVTVSVAVAEFEGQVEVDGGADLERDAVEFAGS